MIFLDVFSSVYVNAEGILERLRLQCSIDEGNALY